MSHWNRAFSLLQQTQSKNGNYRNDFHRRQFHFNESLYSASICCCDSLLVISVYSCFSYNFSIVWSLRSNFDRQLFALFPEIGISPLQHFHRHFRSSSLRQPATYYLFKLRDMKIWTWPELSSPSEHRSTQFWWKHRNLIRAFSPGILKYLAVWKYFSPLIKGHTKQMSSRFQ